MRRSIDFWSALDGFPPVLVRLLARRRIKHAVQAISAEEIAIVSGLTLRRVNEISRCVTWDSVTIGEARSFLNGCEFDPTKPKDRNRHRAYEASCKKKQSNRFQWLTKSGRFHQEYRPLIQGYHEYLQRSAKFSRIAA